MKDFESFVKEMDSMKDLIEKIKRSLNKINPIEPKMLDKNKILLDYGSIEVKMFAPILCKKLNEEIGFSSGKWRVKDGQGVATYLVYDEFPSYEEFPIYSYEHSKCKKPYFLIYETDNGKYEISLEY